jgi:hypothetical protein
MGIPNAVKLIIIYSILNLVYGSFVRTFYTPILAFGLIVSAAALAIHIYIIYRGLWKMERYWMEIFAFFKGIGTVFSISFLALVLMQFGVVGLLYGADALVIVLLDIIIINWLYRNRTTFAKDTSPKAKSALGTKSEWIKLALTLAGILTVPGWLISADFKNMNIALAFIVGWMIFVWLILPEIFKLSRK